MTERIMVMPTEPSDFEWPALLRRYIANGTNRLQLRSRAPYRSVGFWLSIPAELTLAVLGILVIAYGNGLPSALTVSLGIVIAAAAVAMFGSTVYCAWGSIEIERHDTHWIVTRKLGKWTKVVEFAQERVSSVDVYCPYQYRSYWPDEAGQRVRVFLDRTEIGLAIAPNRENRPIEIGAGLFLDEEILHVLQELFDASSSEVAGIAAAKPLADIEGDHET